MNQLEILRYCNWISKSIETKMDNPIIIILSVFFVDHVIFLCIVDTKQTPRPFAQNQVFLFLKKEKKISFTRISPEFY